MRTRIFRENKRNKRHIELEEEWSAYIKGRDNERRFFHAWQDKTFYPSWCFSVEESTENQDMFEGIDAIVKTDVGNIFFQIKSSVRGCIDHSVKYDRQKVIPIIIRSGYSLERIRVMSLQLLTRERDRRLKLGQILIPK